MRKRILSMISCSVIIFLILLAAAPMAAAAEPAPSDRYTATTADGVDLAIKHYKPSEKAQYRKGAQPIIMMPGTLFNFTEFDIYTPQDESYDLKLPDPLAPWAVGDEYIQEDPMRYYSLAYYLWSQGYDVWLANYRGEGRDPYTSGGTTGYSIDDLGIYDVPAIVEKVYEETGQHPVWLGHSLGSTMTYVYLQGAKYGEGWNPHVVSDPALVRERNAGKGKQSIKGLIDLDGPMCLPQYPEWTKLLYILTYIPWFMDLKYIFIEYGDHISEPLINLEQMLWAFFNAIGMPNLSPFNMLIMINPDDIDLNVMKYIFKYTFDGMSTRLMAQYWDAAIYQKFREDYLNGGWNMFNVCPAAPACGDGFYCYTDNLKKMSLPALIFADDALDLTSPDDIYNTYLNKGRNVLDEFYRLPNTAHIEFPMGLNAPTDFYPKIGEWLKKLLNGPEPATTAKSG